MPAKKNTATSKTVETEDYPIPTRAPHLVNNPFAHYTKEQANARLAELYPQLRQIQCEVEQLERIVRSYNVMYYDKDGKVCHAV